MGALNSELIEFQKKKLVAVSPHAILKFAFCSKTPNFHKIAMFEALKPMTEFFLRDYKMFFRMIPPDL